MAYHGRFSSFMSYGIEVWGGSVHSSKVFIEPMSPHRDIFKYLKLLILSSLYFYKLIEAKISMQYDIPTWGSAHRFLTRPGADLRAPRHWLALFEMLSLVVCAGARFLTNLPFSIEACSQKQFLSTLKTFLRNHMLLIFVCGSLLLIVLLQIIILLIFDSIK